MTATQAADCIALSVACRLLRRRRYLAPRAVTGGHVRIVALGVVAKIPGLGRREAAEHRRRLLHNDSRRHIGRKWIDRFRVKVPAASGGPPPRKAIVVPAVFPVAASPNSTLCRREVVVVAAVEVGTVVLPPRYSPPWCWAFAVGPFRANAAVIAVEARRGRFLCIVHLQVPGDRAHARSAG